MEKELKVKIKMLEAKKMRSQYNADMQEKIYAFYRHLPLIIYLMIVLVSLSWGLIDAFTHDVVIPPPEGVFGVEAKTVYGIWELNTRFHVYASWTLFGAALGFLVFLILKIIVSVRIMTLEYLRIEALDKQIKEKNDILDKTPNISDDY